MFKIGQQLGLLSISPINFVGCVGVAHDLSKLFEVLKMTALSLSRPGEPAACKVNREHSISLGQAGR